MFSQINWKVIILKARLIAFIQRQNCRIDVLLKRRFSWQSVLTLLYVFLSIRCPFLFLFLFLFVKKSLIKIAMRNAVHSSTQLPFSLLLIWGSLYPGLQMAPCHHVHLYYKDNIIAFLNSCHLEWHREYWCYLTQLLSLYLKWMHFNYLFIHENIITFVLLDTTAGN